MRPKSNSFLLKAVKYIFLKVFSRLFLLVVNDRYRGSKHVHDRKRRATSDYKFMEAALVVSQDYVDKYGEKDFATVLLVIANMVCIICWDSPPTFIVSECLAIRASDCEFITYAQQNISTSQHTLIRSCKHASRPIRARVLSYSFY